jgi:hypothetical protein
MIDIMENQVIGPAIRHGIEQGIPRGMRSVLFPPCRYSVDPSDGDALDCAAIARMMASRLYRFYPVACAGTSDVAADEISRQFGRGRLGGP